MPTIAYLANQFPCTVEPYVVEEIRELRRRGVNIIPGSARSAAAALEGSLKALAAETLYLQPLRLWPLVNAAWLCVRKFSLLKDLLERALVLGNESPMRRARALLHTCLGAYYAQRLQGRGVTHIHVHHGYFASWIAMVAARFLEIGFSMTLHGSDLLLHAAYLDVKLKHCKFCVTVSDFNRRHILEHYPEVDPEKVTVQRLGIDPVGQTLWPESKSPDTCLIMLAVGRLHPVKDHAFLVRACRQLKNHGIRFLCLIAGEGPQRRVLERQIRDLNLREEVWLLGHVSRQRLDAYYAICDLVVLTSRSEGIPLTLMEAMAHGRPVLAPAITGIPELVADGMTGFLYRAGSLEDFVSRVEMIRDSKSALGPLQRAGRQHVLEHFNRGRNLAAFADSFLARIASAASNSHENPVLQQI